jgi:tRNA(Ile)-lysidine synthase
MAELKWAPNRRAALAVSGGSDSLALMHLFSRWAEEARVPKPAVLTVDHDLRAGSSGEAGFVVDEARKAGLSAYILRWTGKKPKANVEEAARNARYRLMGEWCLAGNRDALFVAHTEDDQAETFLLRLGRGSGVDGLSAMRPRSAYPIAGFDLELLRPLLGISRVDLRGFLKEGGIAWFEDPMNEDPRFTRVRVRQLLPQLAEAGVSAKRIAAAAAHLNRAREALDRQVDAFLERFSRRRSSTLLLDGAALRTVPREIGLRALAAALIAVSGGTYRPRFDRLEAAFDAVSTPDFAKARTLLGCKIGRASKSQACFGPSTLSVTRESARRQTREAPAAAKLKVVVERAKLPKKGRIMAVPCNS